MTDVICLGELLIDFVPTVTGLDLVAADTFRKAAGGAPANVAVGVSRLGLTSGFMGKVGEDGFGRFLADLLARAGVDITTLRFSREARTALAFVSLRADGEREFLFYRSPSADMLFAPEDVDEAALCSAKVLHFGSISLIDEPCRFGALHAVAVARRQGLWVSYDPNSALGPMAERRGGPNGHASGPRRGEYREDWRGRGGFPDRYRGSDRGGRALWHDGLALMAITRGARGCFWLTRDAQGEVPGLEVEAVDTTGAGDAFMAGLLAGLIGSPEAPLDSNTLDRVCLFANAAGAVTTMSRGAIPSLPDRQAVLDLLASRGRSQNSAAVLQGYARTRPTTTTEREHT